MNLSLNPNVKKLIDERVTSGRYPTAEDVVSAAMLSLDQQERLGDFNSGELDDLLAEGERSVERDGTLDGDEAYRQRCERRAAAREQRP